MSKHDWRSLLEPLAIEATYEGRLDALLSVVCASTGLEAAHLYLLDDSGDHLHLERSRGARTVAPSEASEGGAEAIASGPALELPATAASEEPQVVATPVGRFYSVGLAEVGLVQVGPVARRAPRRARRTLDWLAYPLGTVVRQAHEGEILRSRLAALTAREEAGQRLAASALDIGRYVALLLDLALRATRTDAGFVAIVEEDGNVSMRTYSGLSPAAAAAIDLSPDDGFFDWSPAPDGGALILRDLDAAAALGIRQLLAVPLLEGSTPLGVFALLNFGEAGTFDEGSLELLETFADQIRQMLHNERLFGDFATRYLETLKGLSRSLDVRRPHTHGHHERVAANAAAIASELGHDADEVEAVRTAGLIHDAGMAGGSDRADIDHPSVGAGLVERLPLHPWVAPGVAAHHEWWDGWGFPQSAAGEAIPRAGRILGAAEFVDEMSSGDPVRQPWGPDQLVAELGVRSGLQFEPDVADATIRLIRQGSVMLGGQQ